VIEIIEGQWFNPDKIVSVKAIGPNKCVLWTTGQPATEGHVLEYSADQIVDAIESCYDDEDQMEDVEDEPDEDE
jgi:hypothetical protein